MEKNIYNISLNEELEIDNHISIIRVPGGWIYKIRTPFVKPIEVVFVPFSNEFQGTH